MVSRHIELNDCKKAAGTRIDSKWAGVCAYQSAPRSPSENMETALEAERPAKAGAWKAETDSRRARATTAADFIL